MQASYLGPRSQRLVLYCNERRALLLFNSARCNPRTTQTRDFPLYTKRKGARPPGVPTTTRLTERRQRRREPAQSRYLNDTLRMTNQQNTTTLEKTSNDFMTEEILNHHDYRTFITKGWDGNERGREKEKTREIKHSLVSTASSPKKPKEKTRNMHNIFF